MEKRFPQVLLCAACIPWTEDFQLDVPLFRKGVRLLCQQGAGSIYLADQKVMSIEENNPYFKTFSISRGRVLGSVRFEHPADVTREQTDSLLAEMHEKAAGLATEIFDGSTFTSDEMLIKNWAKILETDYPEYLHDDAPALVQRGFGKLMEGIHSLLMIAEPESYTELRSIFFFEDGTSMDLQERYRQTAFAIEKLPKVPKTICLAGGKDKVDALYAGARAGFFKTLVTDSVTARLLYEKIRRQIEQ